MKKVLITGVMGFVGFHLCNHLLNKGVEVVGIDTVEGTKEKKIFEEKLLSIGRNANFHFYNDPVNDLPLVGLLKDVDAVYHLAATTASDAVWDDLPATIQNNVRMTKRLINSCTENTRFIYTSTVQVYGDRLGEITENTPTNPITPYGLTKLAGEAMVLNEKDHKNVKVNILRLPTIYGPWQRQDMTFHQLILSKLEATQKNVPEDRSIIDIVYIDDVIDALVLAGETKHKNEIFNITSGKEREWFKARAHIIGEKDQGWRNERLKVVVSPKKSKDLLKFEAKTLFEKGVASQEEHIKKWLHLYKTV